ncbi:MAG: stage 0 sporulation protein [Ruminococcaceae bacterium]|nr:stage 0 sporulation protein [Oscillospiraceae bacterium]
MTEIITVKFSDNGRKYHFDPNGKKYNVSDRVVVRTANGLALGTVSDSNHSIDESEIVGQLQIVMRKASEEDLLKEEENRELEQNALAICEEKVALLGLEMKMTRVEYSFERDKITFFFTADGRVDFRELVRLLAAHFHTRIELRQIGVRDEARMVGGIGICGRPYCCKQFLDSFVPVSIKMAKVQGLSLNPTKISGSCGRLMCCLQYEQDSYEYLASLTPSVGSTVKTPDGIGIVTEVNLVSGNLFVRLNDSEAAPIKYHRDNVKRISSDRRTNPKTQKNDDN